MPEPEPGASEPTAVRAPQPEPAPAPGAPWMTGAQLAVRPERIPPREEETEHDHRDR